MNLTKHTKPIHLTQGSLQLFIGIGAAVSGILMIIQPDGSLFSFPEGMLQGSPFTSFLIPGILLLAVNGLGNIFSAVLSFRQHAYAGYTGIFFGLGLIVWLFIQVNMIGGGHWLQYFYFALGILELCLGILIRETLHEKKETF